MIWHLSKSNLKPRVGIGFSALDVRRCHDGIAHYTRSLAYAMSPFAEVVPCVFAGEHVNGIDSPCLGYPFYQHVLRSQLGMDSLPKSVQSQLQLYHATDHRIPKVSGLPLVASIFDAVPFIYPQWAQPRLRRTKNWLMQRSGAWPERVICASEYAAQEVSDYWRVPTARIRVIPLAVDVDRFVSVTDQQVLQVKADFRLQRGYFLYVGTMQPRKNLKTLVLAHQQLSVEVREAFPLVVVGASAWSSERLAQQIGADAHIISLGYVSDATLAGLYRGATALVVPSLHEGFGLPVLEGFAAGIPVACSSSTALLEVSAGAALTFDPNSVGEIASVLKYITEQPSDLDCYVAAGFERLRQFSWRRTAELTYGVYQELL